MAERKRIQKRKAAYFGSYGWSGGGSKEVNQLAEALKWDVLSEFTFHGGPTREDLEKGEAFGKAFAEALK